MIGVRFGSHQRTQTVKVRRLRAHEVQLFVADSEVVPGSTISAWVLVRKATTKQPVKHLPVHLSLLEGGTVNDTVELNTDAAGSAAGRIAIPRSREPSSRWTLQARVVSDHQRDAGSAELTLRPREETPGTPRMWAEWTDHAVKPGAEASFVIRVRDAADGPVAGHRLGYWIGPTGTEPPSTEEEWAKVAKFGTTSIAGEVRGSRKAPSTVAQIVGTDLRLVPRTTVEGQQLESKASVHVGAPAPRVELLPAGGVVVGGLPQKLMLRARDGWGRPIAGSFAVTADGLDAKVTTGAEGEAEVLWTPPAVVGARRDVGPCAEGVAAAVVVRPLEAMTAFGGSQAPIELCVTIDREAPWMVQVDPPVVRAGDPLRVQVLGGAKAPRERGGEGRPRRPGDQRLVRRWPARRLDHRPRRCQWALDHQCRDPRPQRGRASPSCHRAGRSAHPACPHGRHGRRPGSSWWRGLRRRRAERRSRPCSRWTPRPQATRGSPWKRPASVTSSSSSLSTPDRWTCPKEPPRWSSRAAALGSSRGCSGAPSGGGLIPRASATARPSWTSSGPPMPRWVDRRDSRCLCATTWVARRPSTLAFPCRRG